MSRSIKSFLLFIIFCISMQACISTRIAQAINGHYYKYSFALREYTSKKNKCAFSNNIFSISFNPEYTRVNYSITNSSSAPIKILWDKTYLVVHQDSSKIITQNIAYADADITPQPSEIKTGQTLQGFITPIDYVKNTGESWVAVPFYPEHDDTTSIKTDWVMGLIGVDIFKLYIPIKSNGETKIYRFTFYPNEMEKSATSQVPKE